MQSRGVTRPMALQEAQDPHDEDEQPGTQEML